MDPRPKLQQVLKAQFERDPHVYHQGPGKEGLKYPCIIYRLIGMPDRFADNNIYMEHRRYQLTVIDPDPDSKLREKVARMKWCHFDRGYVSDNLNHFVFTLYY